MLVHTIWVVLLCIVLPGCGGKQTKLLDNTEGIFVLSKENIVPTTSTLAIADEVKYLCDIPDPYLPKNDGCYHFSKMTDPIDVGQQGYEVTYDSVAGKDDIVQYYKNQLCWHDWQQKMLFKGSEYLLVCHKKNKVVAVSLRPLSVGSRVVIKGLINQI